MVKGLATEIAINADVNTVWQVLIDTECYPSWNPLLRKVRGKLEKGERPLIRIRLAWWFRMTIRPEVLEANQPHDLIWQGNLLAPWIMHGIHSFRIEPNQNGGIRFIHSESFGGIFAPFIIPLIRPKMKRGFIAMNAALKVVAEAG